MGVGDIDHERHLLRELRNGAEALAALAPFEIDVVRFGEPEGDITRVADILVLIWDGAVVCRSAAHHAVSGGQSAALPLEIDHIVVVEYHRAVLGQDLLHVVG